LFNLSGLGVGYLVMRRWWRWLLHFLLTAGLIVAAFLTNAAQNALIWFGLFGLWLAWMGFDGWFQARRAAQAIPRWARERLWLFLTSAILLLAAVAAGLWGYVALGKTAYRDGMAAYRSGACRSALRRFRQVTTLFELNLGRHVLEADARIGECKQLVMAEDQREAGLYADALFTFSSYLDAHPGGELTSFAQNGIGETYNAWAAQLAQARNYEEAVYKYRLTLTSYPDAPAAGDAREGAANAYAEWAVQLASAGDYAAAIEKYQSILQDFAETHMGGRAREDLSQAYGEWGLQLRRSQDYAGAIERFETVLQEYPETFMGGRAEEELAEIYGEWAGQLQQAQDYSGAIEKYGIVRQKYPRTYIGSRAEEEQAKNYNLWALQLREAGQHAAAIQKYEIILGGYPHTSPAAGSREELAKTYTEWAGQLREQLSFSESLAKYETILRDYSDTEAGRAAPVSMGQLYVDWGRFLYLQRSFLLSMEKLEQVPDVTTDAGVRASAEAEYDEALRRLGQDSGADGQQVMDEAADDVCAGRPADSPAIGMAEDEPPRILFAGKEFTLPGDLRATKPAHARYALCVESDSDVVDRCKYTDPGCYGSFCPIKHILIRKRRWWKVTLFDTRTAQEVSHETFYGSWPPSCPSQRIYTFYEESSYGSYPTADDVFEWVRSLLD
jgi:tetratricopeptide (TPR) repeat protein